MKWPSRILLCLLVAATVLTARPVAQAREVFDSYGGPSEHARQSHSGLLSTPAWERYDNAVYVVSTLNLPLCRNGQELSTILRVHDGARIFDVLESTIRPDLYFVRVRTSRERTLAVYAYQIGWTVPLGLRGEQCVRRARAEIVALYRRPAVRFLARFHHCGKLTRCGNSTFIGGA